MQEYQAELKELTAGSINSVERSISSFKEDGQGDLDFLYEYLNNLFLIEIRNFNAVLQQLKEKQTQLKQLFILVVNWMPSCQLPPISIIRILLYSGIHRR